MNDSFQRKITDNSRKIINKIESKHHGKLKYILFYKYLKFILNNDFKRIDELPVKNMGLNKEIPFRFWMMWWQDLDKAPEIVRENISFIRKLMGEKNVIIITKDNYKDYTNISPTLIQKLNQGKISLTNWSDIIRFHLLKENGGYWIDSTVAISPLFKEFLLSKRDSTFITLCESNFNYHNISYNQWTGWLMGGVANFELFEYACKFYDHYFENHDMIIDYFLIDDIISHYYKINPNFRLLCNNCKKDWKPYYWSDNLSSSFDKDMIKKFNTQLEYSIQKLTYKYNSKILVQSDSLLVWLLKSDSWKEVKC